MKKLLLLALGLLIVPALQAQVDTLFIETFNPTDSVTTTSLGSATTTWKDTTNVSISGGQSYHGQVQQPAVGSNSSEVVFRTNSFSTVGKSFVFLEFYHIAKINQVNQGLIRISTDGGTTWTTLNNSNCIYLGNSNWTSSSNFQEATYNIPNQGINHWFAGTDPPVANSWWQYEKFDISTLALGPTSAGFSNVQIEFSCFEVLNPAVAGRPYGAGWWVDNLVVLGSNCELFPPAFHFNYTPIPCFPVQPTGGIVQEPTNNYKVGARVTDTVPGGATNPTWVTGIDSVTVFYRVRNSGTVGPWQNFNLNLVNAAQHEFQGTFNGILVGDTVEYYYRAWDNACPNVTRFPDSLANPTQPYLSFWPETGLPFKCGSPDCGTLPGTISTFPWVEDFEGPMWAAGTGIGDVGTAHRGNFPNEQTGMRYWNVQPPENTGGYAWSVRVGGTSTQFTGPDGNHTPGGARYIYAESSQGAQNTTTTLITPCIDFRTIPATNCMALEFYYHFFGEDMGTMRIDIDTGSNNAAWWTGYKFIRKEQHDSSSQAWKREIVDLTPFAGTFFRIRFLSAKQTPKTGTQARGDMAIDDLKIFNNVDFDAEILNVDLDRKCSYSSTEDVYVVVKNSGCQTLNSLPVQIQLNGGAVLNETLTGLNLATGDTTTYLLTTKLNLTAIRVHDVKVWANLSNDAITANDTAQSLPIPNTPAFSTFPYIWEWENLAPGAQSLNDTLWKGRTELDPNYKFTVGDRYTFTRGTGPKYGYYQKGQYLYTEATGSNGNVATYLESKKCVDLSSLTSPTLDFYYHAMGANVDKITVEYNDAATMNFDEWQEITGSAATLKQTSEVDDFIFHRVDLTPIKNGSIKIRIAVHRTGVGDLADVAIDKIMLYDRIANDAGVEIITNPQYSWPANTVLNLPNVIEQVTVRNFGTSNLTGVTASMAITPLCGANAGQTTVYNSTSSVNVSAGNSAVFNMPNIDIMVPEGDCEICAYTSVTGDNYAFNDTACRIITGLGTYDIDFADDFDNCNYDEYGFFAQGGFEQWERGTVPSGRQFSSTQSSNQIWGTNLTDGYFIDGLTEILRVPILDNFDTIVSATIQFYQNVDMGTAAAGAIQINRGGWNELGGNLSTFSNIGQNWYTGYFGTLQGPTGTGVTKGFVGSSVNGSNPSGWAYSIFPMSQLNYEPNAVPMRFYFRSGTGANTSRTLEGWAIDDFEVYIPPQNSASPIDFIFTNPLQIPTFDQPIDVVLANTGAKLLDTCEVNVQWLDQNGTILDDLGWEGVSFPNFFIEGSRTRYDFMDSIDGATVQSGNYILRLITRRPNDKMDNRPTDDTTDIPVQVFEEFFFDVAAGDTTYCNNFEPGNGALPFIPLNTKTYARGRYTWEKGTPVQFPGAFSGQECWMTGLDSNYRSRDESGLFTPVFVIDTSTAYEISFVHKFDTEKYHDGGVVEVTLDGGRSWQVLGFANEQNWYNTEYVTALDIIKPGWTDTADWDTARYVFKFDTAAERAVFRFRFESDWSVQRKGWAIDDFCMKATSENPTFVVGSKEYNPVPDSYIGNLSPNPSNGITHLPLFNAQAKDIYVNVVNVLGQPVYEKTHSLERGSAQLVFDTFEWKPGIYFVNVTVDGERVTRKLIVQ